MEITVRRVANGYVIRDEGSIETWAVANDDDLLAAHEMLIAVNEFIGRRGDVDGEREMVIAVRVSRRWIAHHPKECSHEGTIDHWQVGDMDRWQCWCGHRFEPVVGDEQHS